MGKEKGTPNEIDQRELQIKAIGMVFEALKSLKPELALNVLDIVAGLIDPEFKSRRKSYPQGINLNVSESSDGNEERSVHMDSKNSDNVQEDNSSESFDGINVIGKKWLTRNNLSSDAVSSIFSLGVDEIDLVSKKVAGNTVAKRMRSVFLLKGIASLLSGGAARFPHDQIREVCQHYDAWDQTNFAKYFKSMSAEVSGNKSAGYTLTTRGLSEAAGLIKEMLNSEKK